MKTEVTWGIVFILLGACSFLGGRLISIKITQSEFVRKILHPESKKPKKALLMRTLSSVLMFVSGLLTGSGGYWIVESLFK